MSDFTERFVDVQGVRTRVLSGGSGPDLVYWHGAGGCGQWFPHLALLAEQFTVYAPENPGWGGSDGPEWMDTIQDYVLHHDALLRELGVERPVLVGHSLGGWMAAEFAATYPERLAALVLICAAGFPFTDELEVPDFFATVARGGSALTQMLFYKPEAATAYLSPQPTPEEILRRYRELTSTARITWHLWFDAKLPRRLARVKAPTLVVWGEHERLFPLELGRQYADAIPGARLAVIEDCGHMAPFESPESVAKAIGAFTKEYKIS
jgi:pimeloyl-ACP methyl ester carboxylesterase